MINHALARHERAIPKAYWNLEDHKETPAVAHYTTFSGALGIIKTKTLWATNIHYLNDYREFANGLDLAKEELRKLAEKTPSFDANVLNRCNERLGCIENLSIYVSSFCEENDILSQWRGYAGGSGVSLLFSFERLREIAHEIGFRIVKCIYTNDDKRAIVHEIIANGLRVSSAFSDENDAAEAAFNFIMHHIVTHVPAFKDNAFSEENEWRMVSQPTSCLDGRISFRTTSTMIIPHFEIDLNINKKYAGDKSDIGLRCVMAGPNNNQKLATDAISMLLSKERIHWRILDCSKAPYRPNI